MPVAKVRNPGARRITVAVALALAFVLPLAAQEEPAPQMFLVHQEVVEPAMLEEYVQTSKDFFALVAANRETMPTFYAQAVQTEEYEFVYVMPLANFAQMDTLMGEFMAMAASGNQEWQKAMEAGAGTTRHFDEHVVLYRPDLSYQPAEPRVQPEEVAAWRWDYYYLKPEKAQDAEAIAKDVAALYREKGIQDGYDIFQGLLGDDLPFLVVSTPGKDQADIESRFGQTAAKLGDAWAPIQQRIHDAVRSYTSKYAWARPDLGLAPPAATEEGGE